MKSGFFDPETLQEFGCWAEIEASLGAERGLALVELGNTLDLFATAMAWLSTRGPGGHAWLSRYESYWAVARRWLAVDATGYKWSYAGPLRPVQRLDLELAFANRQ
jgi:hypothetical protein